MVIAANVEGDEEFEDYFNRRTSLDEQEDKKPEGRYQEVFKNLLYDKKISDEFQNDVEFELNNRNEKKLGVYEKYREQGVRHYIEGEMRQALNCYNESLAYLLGSKKTELARLYCDRSAVYYGLGLYEFCLEDLVRSKSYGCPKNKLHELYYNFSCFYYASKMLKIALAYASKGLDCLRELHEEVDPKTFKYVECQFKKLKYFIEAEQGAGLMESNGRNAAAPSDNNPIDNAQNKYYTEDMARGTIQGNAHFDFLEVLHHNSLKASSVNFKNRFTFYQESSNNIHRQFAAYAEFGYDENNGHHLKAKEQLKPGTTITTDNPFVAILNNNKNNIKHRFYCSYCSERADIMMIPCDYCSEVRFCSNQCRIDAWKEFHYVECGYLEFLNEFDKTGYLCMRILLKEGVTKFAQMPLSELRETEKRNPNLTDPVEFYNFFDNLPLINPTASEVNRAAQGAFKILHFLNRMYSRISKVEDKSLIVEAIDPTISLDKKPALKQEELEILGLQIVKHWLQIDSGLLKITFDRVCSVDQKQPLAIEHPAVSVFPLLHLFRHSCNPNVYYTRFEDGPVVFRAAQTIRKGELLTVAKGVDIYRHSRTRREKELRRICDCIACFRETYSCKSSEVRAFVHRLQDYYLGNQDKKLLTLALDLITQEDIMRIHGDWLFWKLHRYISRVIKRLAENSFQHKSFRLTPECVNDVVTTVLRSLEKIDFRNESLYAMFPLAELLLGYAWNLRRFADLAPSVLGLESFSRLMSLLCTFKDVYRENSINTHNEECIFSVLFSEIELLNSYMN